MYSKGDLCAEEMKVSPKGEKEENDENEKTRKESRKQEIILQKIYFGF